MAADKQTQPNVLTNPRFKEGTRVPRRGNPNLCVCGASPQAALRVDKRQPKKYATAQTTAAPTIHNLLSMVSFYHSTEDNLEFVS